MEWEAFVNGKGDFHVTENKTGAESGKSAVPYRRRWRTLRLLESGCLA